MIFLSYGKQGFYINLTAIVPSLRDNMSHQATHSCGFISKFAIFLSRRATCPLSSGGGGRDHWTVNYTGTQSSVILSSYSLASKL